MDRDPATICLDDAVGAVVHQDTAFAVDAADDVVFVDAARSSKAVGQHHLDIEMDDNRVCTPQAVRMPFVHNPAIWLAR